MRWGAQGWAALLQEQLQHEGQEVRRKAGVSEASVSTQVRREQGLWSVHKPCNQDQEFNRAGLLFRLLLGALQTREILDRVGQQTIRRIATDPVKFHSKHAKGFLQRCPGQTFTGLSYEEQEAALGAFLLAKFSTHPKRASTLPPAGTKPRQADISWGKVFMTREEQLEITQCVVDHYTTMVQLAGVCLDP